jgi:hypothetical protein
MSMSEDQIRAMMSRHEPMRVVPVPGPVARAEVELVRDLQVRTQAASLACQLLAGKAPAIKDWWAVAFSIEQYIRGTESGFGADVQHRQ